MEEPPTRDQFSPTRDQFSPTRDQSSPTTDPTTDQSSPTTDQFSPTRDQSSPTTDPTTDQLSPTTDPTTDQSPVSPHVVGVSLCDSTPLLWRVEDLRVVRGHGLVGALLGSLPRTPRQNGRLGRPLLLLPEEEQLLRKQDAAALLLPSPQEEEGAELVLQVQQHQEDQQRSYKEQSVLALEDRKSALVRAMTSSCTGSGSETGATTEALQGRLEVLDKTFSFPESAMAVQLSTARAGLSYCLKDRDFLQANWPIRKLDGSRFHARYQVFTDLRGRGFYLTSAGKFGGDFLVYPGDPLRFHAHFIAICLSPDESMCLLDVLAASRLGSNVKKTLLLCSPAPHGGVFYTSLQWSGMV